MTDEFAIYLERFESDIIVAGFEQGIFKGKKRMVPLKDGKLDSSKFGKFLGNRFDYKTPMAIDYYGLIKKSTGFENKITDMGKDIQIKALEILVIHFASIKMEAISQLNNNLIVDFPRFKKFLVELRAFNKSKSGGSHGTTHDR